MCGMPLRLVTRVVFVSGIDVTALMPRSSQALAPLGKTLEEMRDMLPSSDPSFRHRMKTFMDELLLVRGITSGRER